MPAEGYIKATIDGSIVFESGTNKTVVDYNITHATRDGSEAWIKVDDDDMTGIEGGQLIVIEIVEWGASAYSQFFYGEIFDILPTAAPDQTIIKARDVFEYFENVDCDTLLAGTIHDNDEFDLQPGTAGNKPYVDLGVLYADVVKPITRVQVGDISDLTTRPDDITGLEATTTVISFANGLEWAATRFVPEATRWFNIRFYATLDANYDFKLCRENPDTGFPDFNETIYTLTNQSYLEPTNFRGDTWTTDTPFRLNKGQAYWILIGPNNPAAAYNFTFYSYPSPGGVGDTGQGVAKNPNPSNNNTWSWAVQNAIGYLQLQWLEMEELEDINQFDLVDNAGNARIEFGGTDLYVPPLALSGSNWQNTCRVFFLEGNTSMDALLVYLAGTKAGLRNDVFGTSPDIPFIEALEGKCGNVMKSVIRSYNWRLRQLHRSEGGRDPPYLIADAEPAFGSPVMTLKAGWDSSDPDTESRAGVPSLKKEMTSGFTGIRLRSEDRDGRLLYWERHDHDLEQEYGLLKGTGVENGFRKARILSVKTLDSIPELNAIAETILARDSDITWKGTLPVDGATWIIPGQTIEYQNSRKGITLTEFRVEKVQYMPNRMILTLNSVRDDIAEIFRQIERDLGQVQALQPITNSDLDHTFFAHGRDTNALFSTITNIRARLRQSSPAGFKSWYADPLVVIDGPTVNGQPSKIIYAFFNLNGGDEGHGTVNSIRLYQIGTSSTLDVGLDNLIYHWNDNACAVCLFIHQ